MKQIYDEDSANAVAKENQQQREWEQSERNRILRMSNPKRKQEAWSKLYPKLAVDNMVY